LARPFRPRAPRKCIVTRGTTRTASTLTLTSKRKGQSWDARCFYGWSEYRSQSSSCSPYLCARRSEIIAVERRAGHRGQVLAGPRRRLHQYYSAYAGGSFSRRTLNPISSRRNAHPAGLTRNFNASGPARFGSRENAPTPSMARCGRKPTSALRVEAQRGWRPRRPTSSTRRSAR
jgi:hypothetical protein